MNMDTHNEVRTQVATQILDKKRKNPHDTHTHTQRIKKKFQNITILIFKLGGKGAVITWFTSSGTATGGETGGKEGQKDGRNGRRGTKGGTMQRDNGTIGQAEEERLRRDRTESSRQPCEQTTSLRQERSAAPKGKWVTVKLGIRFTLIYFIFFLLWLLKKIPVVKCLI